MEIVRSNIFSRYPNLLFGMSTNSGGVSSGIRGLNLSYTVDDNPDHVRKNRSLFFDALSISENNIAFTKQQHTTNITTIVRAGHNENCDALITNQRDIYLAISIADCTPVMLFDPVNNVVAGIHAGWRGAAGNIVKTTLQRMVNEFRCRC